MPPSVLLKLKSRPPFIKSLFIDIPTKSLKLNSKLVISIDPVPSASKSPYTEVIPDSFQLKLIVPEA